MSNNTSPGPCMSNSTGQGPSPIDFGQAGGFAIIAGNSLSSMTSANITGNIAVDSTSAGNISGLSLALDASSKFSTSTSVTGKVYATNYVSPTPSYISAIVGDMQSAYNDTASRAPADFTDLGGGVIGGQQFTPGLYRWNTAVGMATNAILTGCATDTWIFQVNGDMSIAAGAGTTLTGGALAKNIVWQVC
jgi:hypothetical protein